MNVTNLEGIVSYEAAGTASPVCVRRNMLRCFKLDDIILYVRLSADSFTRLAMVKYRIILCVDKTTRTQNG